MKNMSEAPEALALLFRRDGVPNNIIVDGSMEHNQGDFKKKCREVDCRLKKLERASQWGNAEESCIRKPFLTSELAIRYQSFIGVLRWMVEIGRIDMITKMSMLSSHLEIPR